MASRPDLSLPDTVPEMEKYHDTPMTLYPFAVYTLTSLNKTEVDQVIKAASTECEDVKEEGVIKTPPKHQFPGESLKDIVKYHVQLGDQNTFDTRFFVVVVSEKWREEGLLMVTLDDDDLECKPDSYFSRPEETGITMVNLQIANTDWFEAKENECEEWPQDGYGDDHDDDDE